jgi:peptide/nickel transport system substrate-binding protein
MMLRCSHAALLIPLLLTALSPHGLAATYRDNDLPVPSVLIEPPSLAKRVAVGELPPLRERLPEKPVVVGPGTLIVPEHLDWQPGRYGERILVGATSNVNDAPDIRDASMEHIINTPKMHCAPITGNIADLLEVSDDNTVFTIRLRKGLKWSDGHPVTTEDVRFAYEDVLLNEKITPVIYQAYLEGGLSYAPPLGLEILDERTFRVSSSTPYGGFLVYLGVGQRWGGYYTLIRPKHYLQQFHLKYTSLDQMRPLLDKGGLGDQWWRLFTQMDAGNTITSDVAIGFPVLGPWMRVDGPRDRIIMERNPYYFKVDTAGRQLPYIDRYESVRVANIEMIPMKVISEETNILRIRCGLDKLPLYKKFEAAKSYRLPTTLKMHNAPIALFVNMTYDDPTWRTMSQDLRFRQALNLAIDRERIIEVYFFGCARRSRWVPERFDLDEARRLLSEVGLVDRDGDGWRDTPDGRTFVVPTVVKPESTSWVGIMELIADSFREIGLKTTMKALSPALVWRRANANMLQVTLDWLDTPNWEPLIMFDYLPDDRSGYGRLWGQWFRTRGDKGLPPPTWVREGYEIYRTVLAEGPHSPRAPEIGRDLRRWMYTNIALFPLASDVMNPIIFPDDLRNTAHSGMASAAHFAAEQFYFEGD